MIPRHRIIAAVTRNGAIGRNGQLLFHISEDLKNFKETTMGHTVVMGRKTFESLPGGRPLPGRRNIVVTRNPDYHHEGIETASSVKEAIDMGGDDFVYVIGGGEIYNEAIDLVDFMELTIIDVDVDDADTFFPNGNPLDWVVVHSSEKHTDPKTGVKFKYVDLLKIMYYQS